MSGIKNKSTNLTKIVREDIENLSLDEILKIANGRYGLTKSNNLISREMVREYNKLFNRDVILALKKEAAIRVLCGQTNRKNPFANINLLSNATKRLCEQL